MSRLLGFRNIKRIVQSIRTNNSRIQSTDGNHKSVDKVALFSSQPTFPSKQRTFFSRNTPGSFHNEKPLSPILKISRAFTLSLTHSYIVIPGIILYKNTTLAKTRTNLESFQPRNNTLYIEDGHALLVSSILSIFECFILLIRALYLAILFSPTITTAPFAEYFGDSSRKKWLKLVRRTLEIAGPAFIKWGQWAATRPDLFPRDICTELSKLHTQAPEHSYAYTKKTIEKAFGRKIHEIFDDFEEIPVASGSIAQIHRAKLKLKSHGKKTVKPLVVAVKVRHPGVGESIRRDFEIINVVARISGFLPTLKWLRLKDVSFPKPVYPLVHPAVLVETFEQGESVAFYVDELQGHERLKSSLAHIGTHALLKMLLVDNFIHADMHPGNILVRNKSSRKGIFKSKPHVVFLDVGMTAELSGSDRVNLLEFFKAVARRDGDTAAKSMLRLSKQQNCPNPQAFIKEVKESFDFWGTEEGDIVHPADCMHQLLEQVRRHRVNVDGNVCTVMVTTLVLEGWQRKLDPDYDVMHTLQTLLLKEDWAKSLTYTIEGLMAP
ncbi:unnamed protein product [Lactuca saligna]|uniref:ABC1 atypical kinase-like domain-containing protein n=1 Tax=Lactuca saligna TaxID=75948 RepID=A0AA35VIX1_LACSI|nr:unnamed protein product [Lactuca saligna]